MILLWWARVVVGSVSLQLSRGFRAQLISGAVLSPLGGGIYILMARYLGREDLAAYVVVAPMLTGLWGAAMTASGDSISTERGEGTLELLVAAPAPAALVALGRVIATTLQSLIAIPLTLGVAALLGVTLGIADPGRFVMAILALMLSAGAIGFLFAAMFVLARSTNLFTNVINWPLWILGATAFPVAALPETVRWLSPLVALSWAGASLRGAAEGAGDAWWAGILAVVVLSIAYSAIGALLYRVVVRRVRADGSLSSF